MQYDENAEKYGYEGEMTLLKCDELKAYKGDVNIPVYGSIADAEVYIKRDVDAAIAELKDVIHELQVDLKGIKATAYADSVDAGMRERRLRRALYKACANWAFAMDDRLTDKILTSVNSDKIRFIRDRWWRMGHKCLKMVEEYK